MSDRAHYLARSTDPEPTSYAAFLFAAADIIDADPAIEIWMPPFTDLDGLSEASRGFAKRVNPLLKAFDREYRAEAETELLASGVPHHAIADPGYQHLVDRLVAGHRAQDHLASRLHPVQATHASSFTRAARLIAGVYIEMAGRSPNARYVAAAEHLNRGARRQSERTLEKDHVRRAHRKYLQELAHVVNGRIAPSPHVDVDLFLRAELVNLRGLAVGLDEVWRAARERRLFSWLSGAELAHAIHRKHRLPDCLDRALHAITRRERAAA